MVLCYTHYELNDMGVGILVLDMIDDFVYGKLASEGARDIVNEVQGLLQWACENDIPIIFCRDSHSDEDPEIELWGEHAMAGEEGSEVIDELTPYLSLEVTKRYYDAFFDTSLYELILEHSIDTVVLTGVSTDICVQHTAAGAFFRGLKMIVLSDCTASLDADRHESALEYMENMYGADIVTSEELY